MNATHPSWQAALLVWSYVAIFNAFLFAFETFGDVTTQTAPSCCGGVFTVTDISGHVRLAPGDKLDGSANPEWDSESVEGHPLNAFVANLPAGDYTIEIDAVQLRHLPPGKSLRMSIACGNQMLVKNLTLEKVEKVYHVTGKVHHEEDALNGPLTIAFLCGPFPATFSSIHVKDASGKGVACVLARNLAQHIDPAALEIPVVTDPVIYTNPDAPLAQRVDDLVRRMSLQEKVGQMMNHGENIPRLKVPSYNYWNESLHGVAGPGGTGIATVFPEPIGMAAAWDVPLLHQVGDVISTEARAKYNARDPKIGVVGLTFWAPNINIFRDPRWGRGMETYGEDPFLTSRLGVAFIEGMQGDDPHYLKVAAGAKHFAVHSGPENQRYFINVNPPEQDLYDTYLPQFEAAVREAHVEIVMGAFNRLYGIPCTASPFLLHDLLRVQWGFHGHVVSDCTAIDKIWETQKIVPTSVQASALAVNAGCDLECGSTYTALLEAVRKKLVTENAIDTAVRHIFSTRFRLGMFDPPDRVPYSKITEKDNDSPEHRQLALRIAEESLVLLKNDGTLPLDKAKVKSVAVLGPNASSIDVLYGNYNGTSTHPVTILEGLQKAFSNLQVQFQEAVPIDLAPGQTADPAKIAAALKLAAASDVVIYVGGIEPKKIEGENHDRTTIELPQVQTDFLKQLQATGKPIVFVNCSGGAVAMPWEAKNLNAIVQAWYPGEEGGDAVGDVLLGIYNPSGRLPVTFYASDQDLPAYIDYSMANRTYRYFTGQPLYSFGYGLSYTQFHYGTPKLSAQQMTFDGSVAVTVPVTNSGSRDGDEVVQVYERPPNADALHLIRRLCATGRVSLKAGETQDVVLQVSAQALRSWDVTQKKYVVSPGGYELQIGGSSSGIREKASLTIDH